MDKSNQPYGGLSKKFVVKNKAPNPIQITAEQLLREAVERQSEEVKAPNQRIVDEDELEEYRVRKRKEFEDLLRRQRHNLGLWIRYAQWEAGQKELRRARSIYERALNVEFHNTGLWFKYIEMETKHKCINSARNLYDRVTQLLPRIEMFWIKYTHMEEILGNYAGVRAIFDRWMEWGPRDQAWMLYVKFEERCGEIQRCRQVFERYITTSPSQVSFLKFSKFEERHRDIVRARAGFEKAIEILPESSLDENFYIKFAQFEERQKEFDRVKSIFEQAMLRIPTSKSEVLTRKFLAFHKQRGDREELEKAVIDKRRIHYEQQLLMDPYNYDVWVDLLKLEEADGDLERTREVYERAIAQIPPSLQKQHWTRYIYIWINYALFEEIDAKDVKRCRDVYNKIIEILPHKKISFAKIWIYYAEFEVRQLELDRARKIFGRAIAECGKDKIFKAYSTLELRLGNIDRCRTIHAKFIERHPSSPSSWLSMINLEMMAEEHARARALCEMAIDIETLDMAELIWKKYIDIETQLNDKDKVRNLYERLLQRTQHFKVYKAYATFEYEETGSIDRARAVIDRGVKHCKLNGLNEERKLIYDCWLALEKRNGDSAAIAKVQSMKPKIVRIRRNLVGDDGVSLGFEEVTQYIFSDDVTHSSSLKILEKAKRWKEQKKSNAFTSVPYSAPAIPHSVAANPVALPETAAATAPA